MRHIIRTIAVLAAAVITSSTLVAQTATAQAEPKDQKPLSKELTALQGTWDIIKVNGQDAPSGALPPLVIVGDQYTGTDSNNGPEHGSIVLDTTKKPIYFTFVIKDGSDAGKAQLGLLQIDADSITLKLGEPGGATRPTDLSITDSFFTAVLVKRKTL